MFHLNSEPSCTIFFEQLSHFFDLHIVTMPWYKEWSHQVLTLMQSSWTLWMLMRDLHLLWYWWILDIMLNCQINVLWISIIFYSSIIRKKNLYVILEKFDKLFLDYLKWQQQQTMNSFFNSMYVSWEICMLVKTFERIFILYKWQNIWCVFSWSTSLLWQRGDVQFPIFMNMWHLDNTMILLFPKCDIKEVGLYYQHYNTNCVFINYVIRCSAFLIEWNYLKPKMATTTNLCLLGTSSTNICCLQISRFFRLFPFSFIRYDTKKIHPKVNQ